MKQLTLSESFAVKGKGLHSGLEIEAVFNPLLKIQVTSSAVLTLRGSR